LEPIHIKSAGLDPGVILFCCLAGIDLEENMTGNIVVTGVTGVIGVMEGVIGISSVVDPDISI
jgi:hypothetical protein